MDGLYVWLLTNYIHLWDSVDANVGGTTLLYVIIWDYVHSLGTFIHFYFLFGWYFLPHFVCAGFTRDSDLLSMEGAGHH